MAVSVAFCDLAFTNPRLTVTAVWLWQIRFQRRLNILSKELTFWWLKSMVPPRAKWTRWDSGKCAWMQGCLSGAQRSLGYSNIILVMRMWKEGIQKVAVLFITLTNTLKDTFPHSHAFFKVRSRSYKFQAKCKCPWALEIYNLVLPPSYSFLQPF